jgi:hypothetical protein
MPLDIRVDSAEHLRYAVASGTLTDRDLLVAWGDALADPTYDPSIDDLVDVSGADRFEVTPVGAQRLADVMSLCAREPAPGVRPKVACVAPTDVAFGVLRMYEVYRELQGAQAHFFVCRTMAEARCWLALPRPDGGVAAQQAS